MDKGHTLFFLTCYVATAPPPKRYRLPPRAKAQQLQEIRVCTNRTCRRQGSFQTLETLSGLAPPNVAVTSCGCLGRCGAGPNLVVMPDGLVVGHCGTAAQGAEVMLTLFAGGDNSGSHGFDPKSSLNALALRKRADTEYVKRNFTEAELLLSQAIDLKPFGGIHVTFKCRNWQINHQDWRIQLHFHQENDSRRKKRTNLKKRENHKCSSTNQLWPIWFMKTLTNRRKSPSFAVNLLRETVYLSS